MRVLVVLCHPVPGSFGAHLRDVAVGALEPGHETATIDLYGGFDLPPGDLDDAPLDTAEGVVLVYPTWWSSLPAPLMAWVEDTLEAGRWSHVQRLVAVTTHGSSRWVNAVTGHIGRSIVLRGIPAQMAEGATGTFLALYGMDRIDDDRRRRFVAHVERRLRAAFA